MLDMYEYFSYVDKVGCEDVNYQYEDEYKGFDRKLTLRHAWIRLFRFAYIIIMYFKIFLKI